MFLRYLWCVSFSFSLSLDLLNEKKHNSNKIFKFRKTLFSTVTGWEGGSRQYFPQGGLQAIFSTRVFSAGREVNAETQSLVISISTHPVHAL